MSKEQQQICMEECKNIEELKDEELGMDAGGSEEWELISFKCEVCGTCFWQLTREQAWEKVKEHSKETGHYKFTGI